MEDVVIRENEKVAYRGNLPAVFKNSNMNCLALDKCSSESRLKKGIYPLKVVKPDYNSTTHRINDFIDEVVDDVNIQTFIVRPLTQEELDKRTVLEYRQKIEAEKEIMAIKSLIAKGELPEDYGTLA